MPLKFGVFDQNDRSGLPLAVQYEQRLALAELYDRLGFHCFHMSEHHGTSLSMTPSPSVWMAALTQRSLGAFSGHPPGRRRNRLGYSASSLARWGPFPVSSKRADRVDRRQQLTIRNTLTGYGKSNRGRFLCVHPAIRNRASTSPARRRVGQAVPGRGDPLGASQEKIRSRGTLPVASQEKIRMAAERD
jgi:hypothetical protein